MRLLNEQKHCGWCGSEVSYKTNWSSECSDCGYRNFLNPKPCSSILIVRDNSVMMVRRAIDPKKDEYDLPGGYMEVEDDSMEESALRELGEEVGLSTEDVSPLIYLSSAKAPIYEWQGTAINNVAFYYSCNLTNPEQEPTPDQTENSEIIWVTKSDLDDIKFAWDIDKIMLEKYFQKEL